MTLRISDYTNHAGGTEQARAFLYSVAMPMLWEARRMNDSLVVDLDGGYGYTNAFLKPVAKMLGVMREYKREVFFVCTDEPYLVKECQGWMDEVRV